jgi:histidyl-tRNA synthetase
MKDAANLREQGTVVLISRMNKNKKFQKEQLEMSGYKDIREIFNR